MKGIFPKKNLHDHRSILTILFNFYKNEIEIFEEDNFKQNSLHYSIRGDRWDFFLLILSENNFNKFESIENLTNTYFHYALGIIIIYIEFGALNCVKMFLNEKKFAEKYSKILIENIFDKNNQPTLLYFPIKYSNLEAYSQILEFCFEMLNIWFQENKVKKILSKFQKNNNNEQSLLHFSTHFSFNKSFNLFLKYIDKNEVDVNGETCLFYSAKNNDLDFFNFLLNDINIDKNLKNNENKLAMDYLKE
jgi:ankyrin repeat protein